MVLKPAAFVAGLGPAGWLVWAITTGNLSPNPLSDLTNETGLWTLRFLCITLAVTPLRRLTGWNAVIRFRRMFGLFAFFYGTLHFLTYVVAMVASLDLAAACGVGHPWEPARALGRYLKGLHPGVYGPHVHRPLAGLDGRDEAGLGGKRGSRSRSYGSAIEGVVHTGGVRPTSAAAALALIVEVCVDSAEWRHFAKRLRRARATDTERSKP